MLTERHEMRAKAPGRLEFGFGVRATAQADILCAPAAP